MFGETMAHQNGEAKFAKLASESKAMTLAANASDDQPDTPGSSSRTDDEEDIWPEDVEQSFQEALSIYPPIGRRKLLENGKMYGRNELIARYIHKRTNKIRTRKQVSSHIQVLNKKAKKVQVVFHDQKSKQFDPRSTLMPSASPVVPSRNNLNKSMGIGPNLSNHSLLSSMNHSGMSSNNVASLLHPMPSFLSSPSHQQPQQQQQQQQPQLPLPYLSANHPGQQQYKQSLPLQNQRDLHGLSQRIQMLPFPSVNKPLPDIDFNSRDSNHPLQLLNAAASFNHLQSISNQHRMSQIPLGLRVHMKFFSAYLEHENPSVSGMISRHLYVHLTTEFPNMSFNESELERIDIRQIYDKYSGLEDMYQRGPSSAFFLVKFWANMNSGTNYGLHAVSSKYESRERLTLRCATTVCSFGKLVVEKNQVEEPILENGAYVYYFNHSPMCDYMVHFIEKLKMLESTEKMDKVLTNFSVLQVISDPMTGQVLMCTAFLFAVSTTRMPQHSIFKLVLP